MLIRRYSYVLALTLGTLGNNLNALRRRACILSSMMTRVCVSKKKHLLGGALHWKRAR